MGHKAPYQTLKLLLPSIDEVETKRTLKAANRAIAKVSELKGMANLIPNQQILINALTLKESKDSSEIENIITSEDEIYKTIHASGFRPTPQSKEVVNYRKALIKGSQVIREQGFLSVNNIIDIQSLIVGNNAGIRSTPGTVLKNEQTGEVVYTPPQDRQEIDKLLSNFIEYFNLNNKSEIDPLILMSILHFQFESIHPFYDGNGRTGRILNVLHLMLNDLLDIPVLYLSSNIIQSKTEYYKLLNATNKSYAWENWILYMLQIVESTAQQTIDQINEIVLLLNATIEIARTNADKIYRKELVETLFEHPYSKIDYIVKSLSVERKAASRYLKKLEEIGILESHKVGRETIYVNIGLMEILKK